MENLFDKVAKKTTTKSTTKKNEKPLIDIKGEEFDENLKTFAKLKEQSDEINTQMALAQNFVKEETIKKWYDLYKNNGSYPGSALVTSDSESSFMFVPNDKYSVNEKRAKELKDKYGDDIIIEDVSFSFNSNLLDKYANIISDLIQNSNDINDEDKDKLIVANKKVNITKGSIEKAFSLGNGNVEEFLDDINPVYTIKNAKYKD